jgi:hypothetical protein
MIKSIGGNYRSYGLIIVKIAKKSLVLDYGFLDATFETPNHAFALPICIPTFIHCFLHIVSISRLKLLWNPFAYPFDILAFIPTTFQTKLIETCQVLHK